MATEKLNNDELTEVDKNTKDNKELRKLTPEEMLELEENLQSGKLVIEENLDAKEMEEKPANNKLSLKKKLIRFGLIFGISVAGAFGIHKIANPNNSEADVMVDVEERTVEAFERSATEAVNSYFANQNKANFSKIYIKGIENIDNPRVLAVGKFYKQTNQQVYLSINLKNNELVQGDFVKLQALLNTKNIDTITQTEFADYQLKLEEIVSHLLNSANIESIEKSDYEFIIDGQAAKNVLNNTARTEFAEESSKVILGEEYDAVNYTALQTLLKSADNDKQTAALVSSRILSQSTLTLVNGEKVYNYTAQVSVSVGNQQIVYSNVTVQSGNNMTADDVTKILATQLSKKSSEQIKSSTVIQLGDYSVKTLDKLQTYLNNEFVEQMRENSAQSSVNQSSEEESELVP